MKKHFSLRALVFMALSADFGMLLKKVVSPVANLITDSIHIPGGIGTPLSISVIAMASLMVGAFGSGILMSLIQAMTAFFLGTSGSLGALSVVAYLVPGLVIDLILYIFSKTDVEDGTRIYVSSVSGAVSAALTANILVFGLRGIPLLLYIAVSATTGMLCAFLMEMVYMRLRKVLKLEEL